MYMFYYIKLYIKKIKHNTTIQVYRYIGICSITTINIFKIKISFNYLSFKINIQFRLEM